MCSLVLHFETDLTNRIAFCHAAYFISLQYSVSLKSGYLFPCEGGVLNSLKLTQLENAAALKVKVATDVLSSTLL